MAKSPAYRRQQAGRREERVNCWVVFNGFVYGLFFLWVGLWVVFNGLFVGLFLPVRPAVGGTKCRALSEPEPRRGHQHRTGSE